MPRAGDRGYPDEFARGGAVGVHERALNGMGEQEGDTLCALGYPRIRANLPYDSIALM